MDTTAGHARGAPRKFVRRRKTRQKRAVSSSQSSSSNESYDEDQKRQRPRKRLNTRSRSRSRRNSRKNGWINFLMEFRKRPENRHLSVGKAAKLAAERWRKMSEEEREMYKSGRRSSKHLNREMSHCDSDDDDDDDEQVANSELEPHNVKHSNTSMQRRERNTSQGTVRKSVQRKHERCPECGKRRRDYMTHSSYSVSTLSSSTNTDISPSTTSSSTSSNLEEASS